MGETLMFFKQSSYFFIIIIIIIIFFLYSLFASYLLLSFSNLKCIQKTQMSLPEKLKRNLLALDTDRDGQTDGRVTLYALPTILRM